MDTFELPSPSTPMQTNASITEARPQRILPKRNPTKVKRLQINPKRAKKRRW